jgi:hypothetical protein
MKAPFHLKGEGSWNTKSRRRKGTKKPLF